MYKAGVLAVKIYDAEASDGPKHGWNKEDVCKCT